MKIPAYWSKATAEETGRDGKKVRFSCWRSSEVSQEEAHESALAAARRVLQCFLRGQPRQRYGYGEAALREETIERFTDEQGRLTAAITRNAAGVLVLNTDRVMFIDLDFAPASLGEALRNLFARLLGKAPGSLEAQREAQTRRRLEEFFAGPQRGSLRLYRTAAGMRAMATHELFDPTAAETLAALEAVGADPLYVRLCKGQECFRARLTPKPWRCGHVENPLRWPLETDGQRARFEEWNAEYMAKQSTFATCRLLGTLGEERVHPQAERIIEVHDHLTRCRQPLELA